MKLSPREVRACKSFGRLLTQKAVAAELGLSVNSINTYLNRARVKLGLRTRRELLRHCVIQEFVK